MFAKKFTAHGFAKVMTMWITQIQTIALEQSEQEVKHDPW